MKRTLGLGRLLHRTQAAFRATVPFAKVEPHKGWLEALSVAQPHVWRRYVLRGPVEKPLTCLVLSDLHVGSHAGDLDRFDEMVRDLQCHSFDLVLMPGDFVNMQPFGGGRVPPQMIAELLQPLCRQAPVVAVLGNHDAEYGNNYVAAALEAVGISVLFNSAVIVETKAGLINVAGLEDHSTGAPNARKALAGVMQDHPVVVLAHDPASFSDVPEGPVVTVCGHTHGGQVRIPGFGPLVNASAAPLAWTYGHFTERGRNLVVSAGLGTSVFPLRMNCPPEIVELVVEPFGEK